MDLLIMCQIQIQHIYICISAQIQTLINQLAGLIPGSQKKYTMRTRSATDLQS
jgi:hypothetical protein